MERFPKAPGRPHDVKAYLKRVTDTYVIDAYHSLSIEGYQVTADLIERVRTDSWNPERNEGGPRTAERDGGAGILADVPGGTAKRRSGSARR